MKSRLEVNFKGIAIALLKKWWLVTIMFCVTMLGLLSVRSFTKGESRSYTYKSEIHVLSEHMIGETTDNASRLLPIYDSVQLLKSHNFLEMVKEKHNISCNTTQMASMIAVVQKPATRIIEISVTGDDEKIAYLISRSVTSEAPIFLNEVLGESSTRILSEPDHSEEIVITSGFTIKRIFLITIALTVVFILVLILLYVFNNSVKTVHELEELDCVGCIGNTNKKNNNLKNEIQKLRMNLLSMDASTYAVVSSVRGEGKSQIAFELAKDLAEIGKKVLFVNGSFRKATNFLESSQEIKYFDQLAFDAINQGIITVKQYGFDYLSCSEDESQKGIFFAKNILKDALEFFENKYDYIIFDGASLSEGVDSMILSQVCDITLFVVEANRLNVEMIEQNILELKRTTNSRICTVLNKEQGLGKLIRKK